MEKDLQWWFDRANRFELLRFFLVSPGKCRDLGFGIFLEKRFQLDGSFKWVIKNETGVLSKSFLEEMDEELIKEGYFFTLEPMASNRDDDYLNDTRFDTIDEALEGFNKIKQLYIDFVLNFHTGRLKEGTEIKVVE